jgi:hypothetical protein
MRAIAGDAADNGSLMDELFLVASDLRPLDQLCLRFV